MKQYLVSGYLHYGGGETRPARGTAVLEDHEVMDLLNLGIVERQLLQENNRLNTIAYEWRVTSFQPFETQAVAQLAAEPHLNECSVVLPPVDSPLLIEIAPGMLLRAKRPAHAEQREDLLLFDLDTGGMFIGRPPWTHP